MIEGAIPRSPRWQRETHDGRVVGQDRPGTHAEGAIGSLDFEEPAHRTLIPQRQRRHSRRLGLRGGAGHASEPSIGILGKPKPAFERDLHLQALSIGAAKRPDKRDESLEATMPACGVPSLPTWS